MYTESRIAMNYTLQVSCTDNEADGVAAARESIVEAI